MPLNQPQTNVAIEDARPIAVLQAAVALARGVDHSGDEYGEAQSATRQLLRDLVEHGEHTVDLCLRFHVRAGRKAGVRLVRRRESLRDDYLYGLLAALIRAGTDRILVCAAEDCGQLFVKVTRKENCSRRCQSRAFMRKWRAENMRPKKGAAHRGKTTRTK